MDEIEIIRKHPERRERKRIKAAAKYQAKKAMWEQQTPEEQFNNMMMLTMDILRNKAKKAPV